MLSVDLYKVLVKIKLQFLQVLKFFHIHENITSIGWYAFNGCNKLIKEGATIITNTEDVLEILDDLENNIKYQNSLYLKDSIDKILFKERKNIVFKNNIIYEDKKEIKIYDVLNKEKNDILNEKTIDIKEKILSKLNSTPININILSNEKIFT